MTSMYSAVKQAAKLQKIFIVQQHLKSN